MFERSGLFPGRHILLMRFFRKSWTLQENMVDITNISIDDFRESDSRPPSSKLSELHVYIVPRELWVEKRKLARREVCEYSISCGFVRATMSKLRGPAFKMEITEIGLVRILPQSTLTDLRRDIHRQLGYDVVPKNYVFLRNVGRNFTQVRPAQEMEMKVKNYMPPYAPEPEIYLKEGVYTGSYSWSHAGDDSGLEESVTESSNSHLSREDITSPDSSGSSERFQSTTDVFMPPLDTGTQTGTIRSEMAITMATPTNTDTERKRRSRRQARTSPHKSPPSDEKVEDSNGPPSEDLSLALRQYRRRKIYQRGTIVNGLDGILPDWREESRFRKYYNRYEEASGTTSGAEEPAMKSSIPKRDRSLDTLSRIPITIGRPTEKPTNVTSGTRLRPAKSMSSLPVRIKEPRSLPTPAAAEEKSKHVSRRRRRPEKKEESSVVIENTSIRLINEDGNPEQNGAALVRYGEDSSNSDEQIVRHHIILLEGEEDGGTVSDAAAETIHQVQKEIGRRKEESVDSHAEEKENKEEGKEEVKEEKEDEPKLETKTEPDTVEETKEQEDKENKQEDKEGKKEDKEEEVIESSKEADKSQEVEKEVVKEEPKEERKEEDEKEESMMLVKAEDVQEHHLASGDTLQNVSQDGSLQIEVLVKELRDVGDDAAIDGESRDRGSVSRTSRYGYDVSKVRKSRREAGHGNIVYSPGNMRRSRSDGYGLASNKGMHPETPAAERSHRQRLTGTGQWLSSIDIRGHDYYLTERERLLLLLDRLRSDLRLCESRRDELLKRIKQLQNRANHRRDQVRELWRKRYVDAKRITPKLEEECTKMRQELDRLHRELLAKVQAGVAAILVASGKVEKPSNKLSYKIMIARLLQEIEDLRRRVEGTRLKLSAEIKLRTQAERDVKSLREELLKKKIQVTLTRHQEQAAQGNAIREQYFISTV